MADKKESKKRSNTKSSNRNIAFTLIIISAACLLWIAYVSYDIEFWLSKPQEKFATAWSRDMALLERNQKLPKQWTEIREVKIEADNSPVQEWLVGFKPPIKTQTDGKYRLSIFIVHWIEAERYGVLLNYHLEEVETRNTVWESARTLPLGIVY